MKNINDFDKIFITPYIERYSCSCGHLKGRIYDGMICQECDTKVKYVNIDESTTM